jgi:uncharacterized membrane protein YraQ (UPF0718 family)
MLLVAASVLALLVGPLLLRLVGRSEGPVAALDGFVLVAIVGLVGVHLLPDSVMLGGWWALVAAAAGLLLPHGVEHGVEKLGLSGPRAVLVPAMAGFATHALLDGAALGDPGGEHAARDPGALLVAGVLLHRVAEGLAVWWAVRAVHGRAAAGGVVGVVALSTVVGYVLGDWAFERLPLRALGTFQALVAGSLLHVVLAHAPAGLAQATRRHRLPAAGGALVAVGALVALGWPHPTMRDPSGAHAEAHVGATFLALALESAPALLLAFAGAGLLQAFVGPASMRWLGRGSTVAQAARGVAFGLPLPVCSCGVLPVYRSLIAAGAPATAAMAFLVATPEIGLDAFLISVPLLGAELAVVRLACAALVALACGVLVGALVPKAPAGAAVAPSEPRAQPFARRLGGGIHFGLVELVDHIGPWMVVGLVVAALAEPLLQAEWLTALPRGLDVPLLALIGLPGYVCASGATPLVAVLMHKGLSAGAGIAFLLTGPATNVTTFAVLSALHGRRVAALFGVCVATLATALGLLANAVVPTAAVALPAIAPDGHAPWRVAALAAFALLMLASLVRQGPRGLFAQVFTPHEETEGLAGEPVPLAAHGHDHALGRDHDHARPDGARP